MKLLTRREMIDVWMKQGDRYLNSVCCPNCRDILFDNGDRYLCTNDYCSRGYIFKSEVEK